MTTITRDKLLEIIRTLPKRTTYEDAIERLTLSAELKHRLDGLRAGTITTIPHPEVVDRVTKKRRK